MEGIDPPLEISQLPHDENKEWLGNLFLWKHRNSIIFETNHSATESYGSLDNACIKSVVEIASNCPTQRYNHQMALLQMNPTVITVAIIRNSIERDRFGVAAALLRPYREEVNAFARFIWVSAEVDARLVCI